MAGRRCLKALSQLKAGAHIGGCADAWPVFAQSWPGRRTRNVTLPSGGADGLITKDQAMIEITVFCDLCSTIIGSSQTAAAVRAENRHVGGSSRSPFDLCQSCVAQGATISRLMEAAAS